MAIELVTGTPGAGKTTYAVSQRIAKEVGRPIRLPDDTCIKAGLDLGTEVPRRIVVAGIRGLVIEHERLPHVLTRDQPSEKDIDEFQQMDPKSPERPKHQRLPGDPPVDVAPIAQNWWLWCRPGDLIVIDEVQYLAPRGTLGRKPPYWIQALEIHRHYGVDFLVITQHPQLVDTVIRALVGQHSHVRAVMGSSLCMVYTWDHASNPERFNLATKKAWRRGPKDYKQFQSAAAHIKPPSSGRSVLVVVPVLVAAVVLGVLQFKKRFTPEASGSPVLAAASAPSLSPNTALPPPGALGGPPKVVKVSGCWSYRDRCHCIDEQSQPVRLSLDACRDSSASGFVSLVKWEPSRSFPSGVYGASVGGVQSSFGVTSSPAFPASSPVVPASLQLPLK